MGRFDAAHRDELPALAGLPADVLYDDALPFLRELRSRGVKVAIVSNCARKASS